MSPLRSLASFSPDLSSQVRNLVALRFCLFLGAMSSYFIGVMGTLTFAMGGGVGQNAMAVALLNLFQMVGNASGGSFLDRRGPCRHLRWVVALLAVCGMLFQVVATSSTGVLVGAAFFGFCWGASDMVARSYPAYLSDDPDELKRINSLVMLASNAAIVIGPVVGGLIALLGSTQAVFLFLSACSLLSLVPGLRFRPLVEPADEPVAQPTEADRAADAPEPTSRDAALAGFQTIFSSRALTLLFWSTMLCFLGYSAFDPLESLYYRDALRVGAEWMGWLSAAAGVGGILGTALAGLIPGRHMNVRTLLAVLASMGAGCVLYVATSLPWVAMAGQLALGVFNGAFVPIRDTLVQMHTPLARVGRVSAAMLMGYNVAGVVPLLCAPVLARIFGVQGTLVGASVVVTVVPIAILLVRGRALAAMVADEV